MNLTHRLTAALIITIVMALLIMLPGCASMFSPGMSSSEIAAMVKDKNGSVVCLTAIGPYGTYTLKTINLDQNVIKDGALTVSDDCKTVSIETQAPPRLPPPVTPVKPASP